MSERILVIDPGKATGVSAWTLGPDEPLRRINWGIVRGGKEGFEHWLARPEAIDVLSGCGYIICEKYLPDGRIGDPELNPPKIEGMLSFACLLWDLLEPVWQPNVMKRQVSDDLLKHHELWITPEQARGVGHTDGRDVNDTALHALAWAKTTGHEPTIAHYWPDDE